MKKAILVVSFGTTSSEAMEQEVCAVEHTLAEAFPERAFRRAFASGEVRRRLWQRDGVKVDGVVEALEALRLEGYTDVLIQPTHIVNGTEYDRMRAEARLYSAVFDNFVVGEPLLSKSEDYIALSEAIMSEVSDLGYEDALVLVGHGSDHHSNAAYPALEYVFHDRGYDNVFVGTAEGYPSIHEVVRHLDRQLNVRRVLLAPLLVVAGEGIQNVLAGNGDDSWVNQLSERNYTAVPVLRGLGTYPTVRELLVRHAKAALEKKR